ncbi:DUF1642 domain-containing protein [Streptococcus suis]|uniref:DUF1642 domain-containing protein n=1 Tax=Streptococcus suis TaxID=1307 RepID=UPI003BA11018
MNKQEAIEEVTELFGDSIQAKAFRNIIRKLHEPQKVVIPKFIADKIEYCKTAEGYGLFHAMDYCYQYKDSADWLECNEDTFARAWLDGYEVEKEQLYTVTDGNKLYLKEFDELNAVIIIDDVVGAIDYAKRYSDKTEAQKAADELGWVVKEVE